MLRDVFLPVISLRWFCGSEHTVCIASRGAFQWLPHICTCTCDRQGATLRPAHSLPSLGSLLYHHDGVSEMILSLLARETRHACEAKKICASLVGLQEKLIPDNLQGSVDRILEATHGNPLALACLASNFSYS